MKRKVEEKVKIRILLNNIKFLKYIKCIISERFPKTTDKLR